MFVFNWDKQRQTLVEILDELSPIMKRTHHPYRLMNGPYRQLVRAKDDIEEAIRLLELPHKNVEITDQDLNEEVKKRALKNFKTYATKDITGKQVISHEGRKIAVWANLYASVVHTQIIEAREAMRKLPVPKIGG